MRNEQIEVKEETLPKRRGKNWESLFTSSKYEWT